MKVLTQLAGTGVIGDSYRPDLPGNMWKSWEHNGDGTATVTLTDDAARRFDGEVTQMALAFNGGSPWSDIESRFSHYDLSIHKRILAVGWEGQNPVKKRWGEFDAAGKAVPAGFVVSHNSALWRAQVDTTAEPSKTSDDWTLIFEV